MEVTRESFYNALKLPKEFLEGDSSSYNAIQTMLDMVTHAYKKIREGTMLTQFSTMVMVTRNTGSMVNECSRSIWHSSQASGCFFPSSPVNAHPLGSRTVVCDPERGPDTWRIEDPPTAAIDLYSEVRKEGIRRNGSYITSESTVPRVNRCPRCGDELAMKYERDGNGSIRTTEPADCGACGYPKLRQAANWCRHFRLRVKYDGEIECLQPGCKAKFKVGPLPDPNSGSPVRNLNKLSDNGQLRIANEILLRAPDTQEAWGPDYFMAVLERYANDAWECCFPLVLSNPDEVEVPKGGWGWPFPKPEEEMAKPAQPIIPLYCAICSAKTGECEHTRRPANETSPDTVSVNTYVDPKEAEELFRAEVAIDGDNMAVTHNGEVVTYLQVNGTWIESKRTRIGPAAVHSVWQGDECIGWIATPIKGRIRIKAPKPLATGGTIRFDPPMETKKDDELAIEIYHYED